MVILKAERMGYGVPNGRMLQSNLNFQIEDGEVLLISGSNGCGKSTFLKVLLGEMKLAVGELTNIVSEERIDYLPQLENTEIHLPLTLRDVLSISEGSLVKWQDVARFGLLEPHHLDILWNNASGGERKRTLLTRSLMKNPQMLVFDEPLNHLDEPSRATVTQAIARFLRGSTQECPRSAVMVCHQGLGEDHGHLLKIVPLHLERANEGEA